MVLKGMISFTNMFYPSGTHAGELSDEEGDISDEPSVVDSEDIGSLVEQHYLMYMDGLRVSLQKRLPCFGYTPSTSVETRCTSPGYAPANKLIWGIDRCLEWCSPNQHCEISASQPFQ